MAECDFLIVNGLIVDGSDDPAFHGDLAIKDGLILAVGDRCARHPPRMWTATMLSRGLAGAERAP